MNYKTSPSIKENREKIQKQKELLNQKFLSQLQRKSLPVKDTEQEKEKVDKQQIKKVKKQLKAMQKKLDEQKSLLNKYKKESRTEKSNNEVIKRQNWELQQEIAQITTNYKALLNEKNIKLMEESQLKIAAEKEVENLIAQQKRSRKTGNKQINLANQVKELTSLNKTLEQRLKNYDQLMQQEHGDYKQKIYKLQSELDQSKLIEKNMQNNPLYLIKSLKKQMTSEHLPDLISLLEQFISRNNIKYFYREQQNIFYTFMRRVSLLSYHLKKQVLEPYKLRNPRYGWKNEKLGYLTQEGEQWFFVDLTQGDEIKTYPVTESRVPAILVECPAKAIIQAGNAIITTCLTWEKLEINKGNIRGEKYKGEKKQSTVKKYNQFGNFKCLVVGSRYLIDYKNRLELHGCIVEVHNPYEEGFELLKGKINRAEIILVCERHVPHSVWDYIDKRQSFVSVLKTDSKDLISTFTYLTLQRCELI